MDEKQTTLKIGDFVYGIRREWVNDQDGQLIRETYMVTKNFDGRDPRFCQDVKSYASIGGALKFLADIKREHEGTPGVEDVDLSDFPL